MEVYPGTRHYSVSDEREVVSGQSVGWLCWRGRGEAAVYRKRMWRMWRDAAGPSRDQLRPGSAWP